MKHDEIIQSVPQWWAGGAMLRLCRTAVALIAIITRLRPTDFIGRAIILSACSLPAIFLAGLPAISLAGCRKEAPPQPYVRSIDLEALDASCTEAWLRVRFTDSAAPRAFALKRDGQTILSALNSPPDTLVIDEGLLPNRTYTYKAYRLEVRASGFEVVDSSTQPTLTTMDTTSHNFTWQIDTLGDGASSILYDVAIINDTLAYAVGEINVRDSLGNWRNPPYNFAKWNGRTWELSTSSDAGYGYGPLYCIFAFGPNDIWTGSSIPEHWDGQRWTFHGSTRGYQGGFWIRKMFGTSSNDLYVVGDAGNIRHYDGVRWRRIETTPGGGQGGTTLPIMDIYGARDPRTGRYEILCVAADPNIPGRSQVLAIESGTVREMATDPMWEPWGIWFIPQRRYIHAGDGLWEAYRVSGPWVRNTQLPALFKTSVRGQAINDVVVCGAFWLLAHWNGVRWQTYFPRTNNGGFVSVAIKGNMLVAVGGAGGGIDRKALLLIAHRR